MVDTAVADEDGSYTLEASDGPYRLRVRLSGFGDVNVPVTVVAGGEKRLDPTLSIGSMSETVTVSAEAMANASAGRGGAGRNLSSGVAVGTPGGVMGGMVGGLPSAPPPPPAPRIDAYGQAREADAAADGGSLGDLFEYKLKQPVTLAKNQSALVPIVNSEIAAERVALWTGGRPGGTPLRAIWITNSSGLTLDGGSISIIDSNAFAGEGLIEALKPGERRLLSYAAELGVRVKQERSDAPGRITRIRARQGVITQESEQRATWTYTVRNENEARTTMVIEHRLRPGWKLVAGQTAAESTMNTHRFRLVVEPKQDATLIVRETRADSTRVAVNGLNDTWMMQVTQAGVSAQDVERALKPLVDKRAELNAIDRRFTELQTEQQTIATDQQRLRENMKALRGSAEEKVLLQRYTRQLDAQETQLEALKADLARTAAARDTTRQALESLLATLDFDLQGGQ